MILCELELDLSSDCHRFQTGLIFSQQQDEVFDNDGLRATRAEDCCICMPKTLRCFNQGVGIIRNFGAQITFLETVCYVLVPADKNSAAVNTLSGKIALSFLSKLTTWVFSISAAAIK